MPQSSFGQIQAMEPHPEWVHQLAYSLWSWECSQNVSKVTALLNAGTYRDDGGIVPDDAYEDGELPVITVTRQAVNGWKVRENWEDRRITDIRDLAPAIHQRVVSNLAASSLAAEEYISDLAAGRIPIPTDANEAKFITERLKASQDILARSGHLPHTRPKDDTALPGPKVNHKHAIAAKTDEEIEALIWGNPNDTAHIVSPSMIEEGDESIIEVASPLAQSRTNQKSASPPPERPRNS